MSYLLVIDNREKELIDRLDAKGYMYEKMNLDVGDIQFVEVKTRTPYIVIERKTLEDLSSSMKDGRYREQKERMIHAVSARARKIYVLEGKWTEHSSISHKSLRGMIINTMIRDNIQVKEVWGMDETVSFIEDIMSHIEMYADILYKEVCLDEYRDVNIQCKMKKKENLSVEKCFENMLLQIPGISTKTLNVIKDEKRSIGEWMTEMGAMHERGEFISYIENKKNGKNKIGQKRAMEMEKYLFGGEEKKIEMKSRSKPSSSLDHSICLFSDV
jgi:ERCC4-type nuclease